MAVSIHDRLLLLEVIKGLSSGKTVKIFPMISLGFGSCWSKYFKLLLFSSILRLVLWQVLSKLFSLSKYMMPRCVTKKKIAWMWSSICFSHSVALSKQYKCMCVWNKGCLLYVWNQFFKIMSYYTTTCLQKVCPGGGPPASSGWAAGGSEKAAITSGRLRRR